MGDIVDGEVGWGESGARHNDVVNAPSFGSDVVAIAAGGHQTFALKRDGRVFAAGVNDAGQLGDGTTTDRYTAAAVSALGTDTVELARGLFTSMVVRTAAGQIYGWGANDFGELCLGVENDPHPTPLLLEALGSDNAALGKQGLHFFLLPALSHPPRARTPHHHHHHQTPYSYGFNGIYLGVSELRANQEKASVSQAPARTTSSSSSLPATWLVAG